MSTSTIDENTSKGNQRTSLFRCRTCDGAQFSVPWDIIKQAKVLDQMYSDLGLDVNDKSKESAENYEQPVFEFPIRSFYFKKALDWCKHHIGISDPVIEIDPETHEQKWFKMTDYESEFFKRMTNDELAEMMACANYLDVRSLYVYCCQAFAARLRACKSPKEVCAAMGIEQDLTIDEQEEIQRQNVWNSSNYNVDNGNDDS